MDSTPSFGVTMISEVPSNPQLTLTISLLKSHSTDKLEVGGKAAIYF